MAYKKPKGTLDLLPSRARAWRHFTQVADEVFTCYGYEPIVTPMFEKSEVFTRGCGQDSDVASKEMFSVLSIGALRAFRDGSKLKSDQKLALRPEGTASVVRAVAEHNLVPQGAVPAKLYYAGPMFRCERQQKGRYREFRQVGVECLGATDVFADAEMIIMCMRFFEKLGLPQKKMTLLINSMGCETCRVAYVQAIQEYMQAHIDSLCKDCVKRLNTNPLRILDCKNSECAHIISAAPKFSDYLCEECKTSYSQLKAYLDAAHIDYAEDARLVRGFDYYTGTVFEVQIKEGLGSQSAIGGGGRYDKLSRELGGPNIPGLGFAVGFERIMLALEAIGKKVDFDSRVRVYVACVNASVKSQAFSIVQDLRDADIVALSDTQGRSLKSQFKVAGKAHAQLVVVVGPDELENGQVSIRDMFEHTEKKVDIKDVVTACR